MANFKTDGIILSTYDFEEADKLVKVFSRDHGIVSSIAKSIKKPTSKKSHFVDILSYGSFYFAKGKNLDLFLEIKPYDNLQEKIDQKFLNYLFYFAEVLQKSTTEDSYDSEYFDIVSAIRSFLLVSFEHAMLKLQIEVLKHLGAWPEIRKCVKTGKSLKQERYSIKDEIGYNIKDGNEITDRIIKIQIFLDENEAEDILKLDLHEGDFKQIFEIQHYWIEVAIEGDINSFKFIDYE